MKTDLFLDTGAAIASLLAAAFWFLSASTPVPRMVTYWGSAPPSDPFYGAFVHGVAMSRDAALCAFVAALFLGLSTLRKARRRSPV